ncbi:amidase signature domain-containing protein [Aspergillus heterothallicus]
MVTTAMDTICAQDGLFGYVGDSSDFLSQTENYTQRDLSPQKKDLLSIAHLVRRYHRGLEEPVRIVNMIYDRIDNYKEGDFEGWTCLQSRETVIADAEALSVRYKDKHCLPTLFGVPFAVQDAFDVAGIPTAAGAQGHSYTPTTTAPAVQALLDAGAIFVGKLNSEMLKTGVFDLPAPHDTSSSAHALEGSSAHSTGPAAAVSAGLVSFILRTDTTGESLPPCRSNGVVTLKTTKGTIPTQGVVSISPSLDTISITAQSVEDARTVWLELQKCDNSTEPYVKPFASLPTWHVDSRDTSSWKSRFRFAVSPGFLGDTACSPKHAKLLGETVKSLESCGGRRVEIDYEPFETASKLLVPNDTAAPNLLVLEHIATIGTDTIERNLATMHLGQQEIYKHQLSASTFKPWEIFQSQARLAECARKAQTLFDPLNSSYQCSGSLRGHRKCWFS